MNLFQGDCLPILSAMEAESMDSLVTDPPAGISFMGKAWDDDKGGRDAWVSWLTEVMAECMRVLKPGAHGLVWALPRTSHWTATALENAGFEIRDVVTHLFGTGFPKSMDISKAIDKAAGAEREVVGQSPNWRPAKTHGGAGFDAAVGDGPAVMNLTAPSTDAAKKWQGYGTALKPASEHWILIRKPLSEKTVAANVLKHGTGGINIDGCRISTADDLNGGAYRGVRTATNEMFKGVDGTGQTYVAPTGRFPANLVLDEEAAAMLDEQSGDLKGPGGFCDTSKARGGMQTVMPKRSDTQYPGQTGGASRFFYVAKASKKDRNRKARDARQQAPDSEVNGADGLFSEACDTSRREGA